jgi:hypothetical protein
VLESAGCRTCGQIPAFSRAKDDSTPSARTRSSIDVIAPASRQGGCSLCLPLPTQIFICAWGLLHGWAGCVGGPGASPSPPHNGRHKWFSLACRCTGHLCPGSGSAGGAGTISAGSGRDALLPPECDRIRGHCERVRATPACMQAAIRAPSMDMHAHACNSLSLSLP